MLGMTLRDPEHGGYHQASPHDGLLEQASPSSSSGVKLLVQAGKVVLVDGLLDGWP
jgi:hypothetical protein